MTRTFEGFVYKRTKVRGYEFPFATRYEFSALIFDLKMVGHKFNFPADFNQAVKVGHKIEISMDNSILNKDFIIIREGSEVKDIGKALITDPAIEYKFFAGYITLPVDEDGIVSIHKPQMVGSDGVEVIKVPVDMLDDREEMMCSDWHIKGIRVLRSVEVTEIISTEPKFTRKTWEENISRVHFGEHGLMMRRMGKSIFIPSDILPFNTTEDLNNHKHKIIGNIKVTMLYRLRSRWKVSRNEEERRWTPVIPEKIEFTDPVSVEQIRRFVGGSDV